MSLSAEDAAAAILTRAVKFETENRLTEAVVCYQEGIELLLKALSGFSGDKKQQLSGKIDQYLTHAEKVKRRVNQLQQAGHFHEQINIDDNATGFSYDSLFGRFIDGSVNQIIVEDPYIRIHHQFSNFVRFCELIVKKRRQVTQVCAIKLITASGGKQEQNAILNDIRKNMQPYRLDLTVEYNPTLHDRQITLSNGYIIKIGRGLDIFKPINSKYAIGVFDFDLRPCFQTTVDIFHQKDITKIGS